MNIISLDSFKIIRIKNRVYEIHKMNYRESIEFSIIYSSYVKMITGHKFFVILKKMNFFEKLKSSKAIKNKERQILQSLGLKKFKHCDFMEIIRQVNVWIKKENDEITELLNINDDNKQSQKQEQEGESFSEQQIIAYFAINFHYSKKEVYELYPAEIPILIRKGDIIIETNILKQVSATLAPTEFIKEYKKKVLNDKPRNIQVMHQEKRDKVAIKNLDGLILAQKTNYERGKKDVS